MSKEQNRCFALVVLVSTQGLVLSNGSWPQADLRQGPRIPTQGRMAGKKYYTGNHCSIEADFVTELLVIDPGES